MNAKKRAPMRHVAGLIFNRPLAVTAARVDEILAAVRLRLMGGADPKTLTAERLVIDESMPSEPAYDITADGIAVLDVCGTFVKHGDAMDAMSGLTSYETVAENFQSALDDGRVKAILLSVNSPGGQVNGMFELGDLIFNARDQKPIYAIADEHAFSAAYLIASSAEQVFVPMTGEVGSVGVIAVRLDATAADEMEGLAYTIVTSGKRKAEGNPHTTPSAPELKDLAVKVGTIGDMFIEAVARNRNVTADAIRKLEAGTYLGVDGVAHELADAVDTVDGVLARLRDRISSRAPSTRTARGGGRMADTGKVAAEGAAPDVKASGGGDQPQPQPTPAPIPPKPDAAAAASNVVFIDETDIERRVRAKMAAEHEEIKALCDLVAGDDQVQAAQYLNACQSDPAVKDAATARAKLQTLRAEASESTHINSNHAASTRSTLGSQTKIDAKFADESYERRRQAVRRAQGKE